jgi:hypothetical protein
MGFQAGLVSSYAVVALVVLVAAFRLTRGRGWGGREAAWFGTAFVLAATAEYWLAGPLSFIRPTTDLDFSLPTQMFLAGLTDGGRFSHAYALGNDVDGLTFFSGQHISFERLLLSVLPLWMAHGLQKLVAVGLGFWGTYLVVRRGLGAERTVALGLAGLYPLSNQTFINITWGMSLGYALMPLAVYVTVFRLGRPRYWPAVVAVAALHAVACAPTHTGLAFFPTLVIAGLFAGWRAGLRALPAVLLFLVLVLLNWHDGLAAKAAIGPFTMRGEEVVLAPGSFAEGVATLLQSLAEFPEIVGLAVIGLGVMAWRRDERFGRIALAAMASAGLGMVLLVLPWKALGLGMLSGLNFLYMKYGFALVGLMTFAAALRGWRPQAAPWPAAVPAAVPAAAVLALAIGQLAYFKAYNLSVWLAHGGLTVVSANVERLQHRSWGLGETVRVVTVPYRMTANIAAAAGLDTADGGFNLILARQAHFWLEGVLKQFQDVGGGYVTLEPENWDFKCCALYAIDDYADVDLLRIANVGYVISTLPLQGDGLVQVAGPKADEQVPPRNTAPLARRLAGYLSLIVEPPPLRIYSTGTHLPRVFAANNLLRQADGLPDRDFMAAIKRHALNGAVVSRAGETPSDATASASTVVTGFQLVRDGVEAAVAAPEGGLVVFNAPFTPFWQAYADGRRVALFPVNQIQMAAAVPAGTARLDFRYERTALVKAGPSR